MANESILIIDDSPVNLKLARILLASQGYLIRTAPDGAEALSMLSTFRPHLVLTDVQLPGIDGLEVTRAGTNSATWRTGPDSISVIVSNGRCGFVQA